MVWLGKYGLCFWNAITQYYLKTTRAWIPLWGAVLDADVLGCYYGA